MLISNDYLLTVNDYLYIILAEVLIMEQLFTLEEAKNYLKISYATIRRCIKDGRLDSQMIGRQYRITETALRAFLDAQGKPKGEETSNE